MRAELITQGQLAAVPTVMWTCGDRVTHITLIILSETGGAGVTCTLTQTRAGSAARRIQRVALGANGRLEATYTEPGIVFEPTDVLIGDDGGTGGVVDYSIYGVVEETDI